MQKDAIEALLAQGRLTADPRHKFYKCPQEPDHVYHVAGPDGRLERVYAVAPPAANDCYDLETVVARAAEWHAIEQLAEVWYARHRVQAVFDRDRAGLDLTPSRPLQVLQSWEAGAALKQADLVHHLRVTFAGCLPAHPSLLADVRRVDIRKVQESRSEVQRASASMSKSLVAEASGADRLPDVLAFDVPVFAEAAVPVTARVRAAFDLDSQAEAFRVFVLPGEVERAFADAEAATRRRLADLLGEREGGDKIPVYHGEP